MRTTFAQQLGIEYPIFAFSHCRDVVAAVSKAGGVGVLGTTRQTVEELEHDLKWLDERLEHHVYGVDLLFPAKTAGDDLDELRETIPPDHRTYVDGLRDRFHIPPPKEGHAHEADNLAPTHTGAREKFAIAMSFQPRVVVSALGPAPADLVAEVHDAGRIVGGLVGAPGQASRHVAAGADFVVAQGTEAGGHTGEISTLVLVPQVVDEVAGTPVLAAGGISDGRQIAAALALGAEGVWTGSIWLATVESDVLDEVKQKLVAASSRDTTRSRCLTGKPIRQLRTPWVDAWGEPEAPAPLPAPQQGLLVRDTMAGIFDHRITPLMGTAVGQGVGMIRAVRRSRDVMDDLIEQFVDAASRVAAPARAMSPPDTNPKVVREDDDRGVVVLSLDHDEARNAMSPAIVAELRSAFVSIASEDVRAVVLTGRGRAFSAGADISHLERLAGASYEGNLDDSRLNDSLFRAVDECPHPVIARVNGHAIGGGAALVACCDIAVASRDAKFGFGEVRIGISPAVVSTFVVAKIGMSAARRFLVTGAPFTAETARAVGLVHEVVDAEALDAATDAVIDEVLVAWPGAQRATKQLLSSWSAAEREAYRAIAIETAARVRSSEEGKRGMGAFLDEARRRAGDAPRGTPP